MPRQVSESYCVLKPDGIIVRDFLLSELSLPPVGATIKKEIFSTAKKRTLDRAKGIDTVLSNAPISHKLLKRFLVGLIEEVNEGYFYGCDTVTDSVAIRKRQKALKDYKLFDCLSDQENWRIPEYIYINVPRPPDQKNLRTELAQSLRSLDYSVQNKQFNININNFFVFSVEAPGYASQRWVMSRLLKKVKNNFKQHNCIVKYVRMVDIDGANTEYSYDDFLEAFLKPDDNSSEEITLDLLLKPEQGKAVVLIIHGFRKNLTIQRNFFMDICKILNHSSAVMQSQVKIFWLDESPPYFMRQEGLNKEAWEIEMAKSTHLIPKLEVIEQGDFDNWIEHDNEKFDFLNNIKSREIFQNGLGWKEPDQVLNDVCLQLGIEGVKLIQHQWSLTS